MKSFEIFKKCINFYKFLNKKLNKSENLTNNTIIYIKKFVLLW